jgi:hypothetical protein
MQATTIETFVIGIIFEEAIKANVDKDFQLKANIEILQKLRI